MDYLGFISLSPVHLVILDTILQEYFLLVIVDFNTLLKESHNHVVTLEDERSSKWPQMLYFIRYINY